MVNNTTPPQNNLPIEVTETQKVSLPTKKDLTESDALLKGIIEDKGVFDLLDIVLAELAEESVSLKLERLKKEFENKETDRLSLRRANILKIISDTLIQKRNLALNDFINLRSPQWQVVFAQLMTKMEKTFVELKFSSEQIELFFQKFTKNLEGFEEETEQKLKETAV